MNRCLEVVSVFFKLGCMAFGGPAAHIALMDDEIVTKRQWMTREHFLDLLGVTHLIPGPNSTEMAIHCAYHRAGFWGLVFGGMSFIVPSLIFTTILAYVYGQFGSLEMIEPFYFGIRIAVLALIGMAILKLGKKSLKGKPHFLITSLVIILALLDIHPILAMLGPAFIGGLWLNRSDSLKNLNMFVIAALPLTTTAVTATSENTVSLTKIFLVFLKVGSVLFGSGYVLIAYLQNEFVTHRGWLSSQVLLDAIAIGQFTPGPVLSTSAFIGYHMYGIPGAILASIGIFLPSFIFVLLLNPVIGKLRKWTWCANYLDAVNSAAVGLMIAVTLQLSWVVIRDIKSFVIAILCFGLVFWKSKVHPLLLLGLASLAGWLLQLI